ncbi:thioredoxin [Pyxidicoccus xibeiensis]|uniref:thioredoxin n=1 Tax=Pyxidicoccus xibeiensis TaxID=2906759 RepID=UPI0020A79E15|nr:thioredoxin [Pyxidicoccus xibeiensis]MCP3143457.1 thioredoxin [Pyxidicoccus xibeiensis]
MAGDVITVGDAEFGREVLESKEPVLVDFTAAWCAPCRAISPVVDALATEYRGRMKVAKVDVDVNQATAQQYGIRAMPTFLIFKEGRVVKQLVGAMPRKKLEEELRQHL